MQRVQVVTPSFDSKGRKGTVLALVFVEGRLWAAVRWDDRKDPQMRLMAELEAIDDGYVTPWALQTLKEQKRERG